MRPGLVFLGLFGVLIAVYVMLVEALGTVPTFLLQAAIVVILLAAALWFRRRANRRRRSQSPAEPSPEDTSTTPQS